LAAAGGDWKNRAHFFGVAAGMMRRVLIDHARKRGSVKRGSAALKIEWDDGLIGECLDLDQFLDVDKAIRRLAKVDERMARVVELRCFGGLTEEEIGLVIDLSPRTVKRDWRVAKEWLKAELSRKPRASTGKQGS
jgi:RNA polymerase sigma factor (TIGR02999 family)